MCISDETYTLCLLYCLWYLIGLGAIAHLHVITTAFCFDVMTSSGLQSRACLFHTNPGLEQCDPTAGSLPPTGAVSCGKQRTYRWIEIRIRVKQSGAWRTETSTVGPRQETMNLKPSFPRITNSKHHSRFFWIAPVPSGREKKTHKFPNVLYSFWTFPVRECYIFSY